MKYKIISLIMIIPVVLMLCVFSAVNIVSLSVPIPVVGINLNNGLEEYLDIARVTDSVQIRANVEPTNATNKLINYTTEPVEGKKEARVIISTDGKIMPVEVGTLKIICTTADGAFMKSFILEVGSTKATDLTVSIPNGTNTVIVGDKFTIEGKIYPEYVDTQIEWSSSNEDILKVNPLTGEALALSTGEVIITARVLDGLDGEIVKTLKLKVASLATDSGIVVNGDENYETKTYNNQLKLLAYINLEDESFNVTEDLINIDYDSDAVQSVKLTKKSNSLFELVVDLKSSFVGNTEVNLSINLPQYVGKKSTILVNKIGDENDFVVKVNGLKEYMKLNSRNIFSVRIEPEASGATYEVNVADSSVLSVVKSDNIFQLTALKKGSSDITITTKLNGVVLKEEVKAITVVNPVSQLNLKESVATYGISNELAIGGQKIVNGVYESSEYVFSLTNAVENALVWTSSDEKIATIDNGVMKIISDGVVTITATDKDSILLGKPVSTSIKVRCVTKGVNVSTYAELMKASKDSKEIVLSNNIDLGEKLINVNSDGSTSLLKSEAECAKILRSEVSEMETTYEWNYYCYAEGYTSPPKIKYCVRFNNNLYGNGYALNADNITNVTDGTGAPYSFSVFKGALDFVKVKSSNGTDTSSVKGQDNIAYVIGENVRIDNVQLIGANMRGNSSTDLNQLNNVGTTVEVVGDNVQIVNSRIRNGKNVLRVYGDEKDKMKKINVTISSCELSYAREFLVKLGTNAVVKGEFADRASYNLSQGLSDDNPIWEACAPKINGLQHLNSKSLSNAEYESLVDRYLTDKTYQSLVKTNLTLENCILKTSGLFCIGIEGFFAGPALDGGRWNSWNFYDQGWRQIAGTAYPVQLNLVGNVRLYDWKDLSKIDSSTLMEGSMFSLKMSELISAVSKKDTFNAITSEVNGTTYVHGGVVMFGGGKNYGLVNVADSIESFGNYQITLKEVGTTLMNMMSYASGKEPFRFLLYDKNSSFNYHQQELELSNGTAYNYLGKFTY